MTKAPKVREKVYLVIQSGFPELDVYYSRKNARSNKGNGIVIDVPLSDFQQKRFQEITNRVYGEV